jgi:hypothetical protein
MLSSPLDIIKDDNLLPTLESTSHSAKMRPVVDKENTKNKKIGGLFSLESPTFNNRFNKVVDSAMRRIHTLIARNGRQGLDVDIIQETFAFEDSGLLAALKKLEKLNTIEWINDTRVILSENLVKITGSTIEVYVEKVIPGRALVIVNEKWHARLNHYDYEGPREILRKGSEFKAVGELYYDEGVFSLRVKQ